jgi:PilZ domain
MLKGENRRSNRVRFDHKHAVNLMGVDGTWRRSCVLLDVSASGAKVEIEGSVEVLQSKEFFLLLSSTGLAFRRCELVWIDGCNAGIRFVQAKPGGKKADSSEKKAEKKQ